MPIIQTQISAGKQPSGTKYITTNGIVDVSDYANADVQVPTTAPLSYLEFEVDNYDQLIHSTNATNFINLNNAKDIGSCVLYQAYKNCKNITDVDMGSLVNLSNEKACFGTFGGCTNLSNVNLSSLEEVSGSYACNYMFQGCNKLTSINLNSLTHISGSYGCNNMFYVCEYLTDVNLSNLTIVFVGSDACNCMFQGCSRLNNINLSSLTSLKGGNSCKYMFVRCYDLSSIDLDSLVDVSGNYSCQEMFEDCTSLATVKISRLAKLGTGSLTQMFKNCTSLTELRFSGLPYTTTNLNNAFSNMLQGVTGVTVHFPAEWETTMSTWSNITNGMGGTNTTVLWDLPNVSTLDLLDKTIIRGYEFGSFAANNYFPNITKIDLSNLLTIPGEYSLQNMFQGCTGLVSADMSSLVSISGYQACSSIFKDCTNFTNIDFSSLAEIVDRSSFSYAFQNCTNLTTLYFPSLKIFGDYTNQFNNMLSGVTGCTVHFPSNISEKMAKMSGYPNFGGTNTQVLYDLPATVTLTGTDTVIYTRNPKYDTVTALAWKVGAYGTTNFTPAYYTSGTTDPSIGDTIYSDASCTTSVTTIDSIA